MNGDGIVDTHDLTTVVQALSKGLPYGVAAHVDVNRDGELEDGYYDLVPVHEIYINNLPLPGPDGQYDARAAGAQLDDLCGSLESMQDIGGAMIIPVP
ncbi:MAG: hypothetical protein ACTS27_04585 [Phycisphaerales bacterium]